jgi:hypothetical protein
MTDTGGLQCTAITKRGKQCKKRAKRGTPYCSIHKSYGGAIGISPPPPSAPSNMDLEILALKFVEQASQDILTLARVKSQYCSNNLASPIKDVLKRHESTLTRIIAGDEARKIPGIQGIVRDIGATHKPPKISSLQTKFLSESRLFKEAILRHCPMSKSETWLADIKLEIKVDITGQYGNCKDIPRGMIEWVERGNSDRVWKNKQLLCNACAEGAKIPFTQGQILWDDYEVVHVDAKKQAWVGIAQKKEKGMLNAFMQGLLDALKGGLSLLLQLIKLILKTFIALLKLMARKTSAYLRKMLLRYIEYVICIAVFASLISGAYPQIWKAFPQGVLRFLSDIFTANSTLSKELVVYHHLPPVEKALMAYSHKSFLDAMAAGTLFFSQAKNLSNALKTNELEVIRKQNKAMESYRRAMNGKNVPSQLYIGPPHPTSAVNYVHLGNSPEFVLVGASKAQEWYGDKLLFRSVDRKGIKHVLAVAAGMKVAAGMQKMLPDVKMLSEYFGTYVINPVQYYANEWKHEILSRILRQILVHLDGNAGEGVLVKTEVLEKMVAVIKSET